MASMKINFSRALIPLAAFSIAAFAADVSVDYNHHAEFSRYHTYTWLGVQAGSLWQDRIMQAVDSQLAAKGWTRVPSGGDATVSAIGKTSEQDTIETFYNGFPGWGWRGWGGGLGMATTNVVPERIGNLTVDIFDSANKQLIWRGTASEAISANKPEKNEKKMDEAVEKLFKNFPPPSKG
jgi:hypothetical protein